MKRPGIQIGGILRIGIAGLVILAQLLLLALVVINLRNHAVYLFFILEIIALVEILTLVDYEIAPPYRMAWTVVILILPVFGWILYLLWGKAGTESKKSRTMRSVISQTQNYLFSFQDETGAIIEALPETRRRTCRFLHNEGFPAYQNTAGKYYRQGEDLFAELLTDLQAAKEFIFIEFFIVSSGRLWQQIFAILQKKARAGVEVRLMYDDLGSLLCLPDELINGQAEASGIQVCAFNPVHHHIARFYLNYRNHRKTVVVDGEIAYTGGVNLADEYANIYQRYGHWKDTGIRLSGDAVWSLTVSFLQIWAAESGEDEIAAAAWEKYNTRSSAASPGYYQPFYDGPVNNPQNPAEEAYRQIINQADKYIYISTPYLVIDDAMASDLCIAAKSGIDVRIITPKIPDRWYVHQVTRSNYGRLLKYGVKIYEYTPGYIHAKTIISDDDQAITGTINMDYRSFHLHFESGVWICRSPIINDIKNDFEQTMATSEQIKYEEWLGRPWLAKPLQAMLRIFSPLL